MGSKIYDFQKDLPISQSEQYEPQWWVIYERMFGKEFNNMEIERSKELQAKQVDRILMMESGTELRIEEKADSYENQRIALEIWSDEEHKRPGWLLKPSVSSWVAYEKKKLGVCLFLPTKALKQAYEANKERWEDLAKREIGDFKWGLAQNPGYRSLCLLVPIRELLKHVKEAKLIRYRDD